MIVSEGDLDQVIGGFGMGKKRSALRYIFCHPSGSRPPRPVTHVYHASGIIPHARRKGMGSLVNMMVILKNGINAMLLEQRTP